MGEASTAFPQVMAQLVVITVLPTVDLGVSAIMDILPAPGLVETLVVSLIVPMVPAIVLI